MEPTGFEPVTSTLPAWYGALADGGRRWREVASLLAFRPLRRFGRALFAEAGFPAFGHLLGTSSVSVTAGIVGRYTVSTPRVA